MDQSSLCNAQRLFYIPRATWYKVLDKCQVKDGVNDCWCEGLVYQSMDDHKVYARAYKDFNMDNWEVIA